MPPAEPPPPNLAIVRRTIAVAERQRSSTQHLDAVLTALADAQHGVVARTQLLAAGAGEGEIRARMRSGHLHRVRGGVYAVGRRRLTASGQRMAAVLACGRGARLAGWSGATQRGLLPEAGSRIDVAIPAARRVRLGGLAIHRTDARPGDVELVDGIPTHSVPRLLLDIAAANDAETLEWAWRQAIFCDVLPIEGVERLLGEADGRPGTPALRALYERRAALVGTLRNRFELLMLSIIREAGLPEPLCNAELEVAPGLVLRPDFRIPELHLIIESDGRDGHADVEFLLTDDQRDALYAAGAYGVMRWSYWSARRERARVVAALRAWADDRRR